jgi:hypothetical protein
MAIYIPHVATSSNLDTALVDRTAPLGLKTPRNRVSRFPEVWELVGPDSKPGKLADLAYIQGKIPMLIEHRGNYDTGWWTLYWTSELGGWAARTPRPGIVDPPGPQHVLFRRIDASRCEHRNMQWTEHGSTYRTARCPDCGLTDSHDSGD